LGALGGMGTGKAAKSRSSRLGVDFVRSLKPQLRVPQQGSVFVTVKQAQGGDQLGAVVWDCVSRHLSNCHVGDMANK
jgi:hypothetical protein